MFDVVCPRYDFTVLLSVGCTVGVLVALYIIFRLESYSGSAYVCLCMNPPGYRAYKLLFMSYCVNLARQTEDSAPPRHTHHTIFRLPRARGCSAPRPQRDKGATPPPPYDSPPPYHVAVVMAPGSPAPATAPVEVHISDPVYI